jgi:hypothetical protein
VEWVENVRIDGKVSTDECLYGICINYSRVAFAGIAVVSTLNSKQKMEHDMKQLLLLASGTKTGLTFNLTSANVRLSVPVVLSDVDQMYINIVKHVESLENY